MDFESLIFKWNNGKKRAAQKKFASYLGKSESTISGWVNGRGAPPGEDSLKKMAEAFGRDEKYVMDVIRRAKEVWAKSNALLRETPAEPYGIRMEIKDLQNKYEALMIEVENLKIMVSQSQKGPERNVQQTDRSGPDQLPGEEHVSNQ